MISHHRSHVGVLIGELLPVRVLLGKLFIALVVLLSVSSAGSLVHFVIRTARRFLRRCVTLGASIDTFRCCERVVHFYF